MPYDPSATRLTEARSDDWIDLPLDGTLEQLPSLSDTSVKLLNEYRDDDFPDGIKTFWQLLGQFLLLRQRGITGLKHLETFYDFLEGDVGLPPQHLNTVVQAIAIKIDVGIVNLPLTVGEALRTSSRMTEQDFLALHEKTKNCTFAEQPDKVFMGLSAGGAGMKSLAGHQIETTWQIIGTLLATMDDCSENTPDEFVAWLSDMGVAPGWNNTVAYTAVELVKKGLFLNTGLFADPRSPLKPRPPLKAIPEEDKKGEQEDKKREQGGDKLQSNPKDNNVALLTHLLMSLLLAAGLFFLKDAAQSLPAWSGQ